MSAPGGSTLVGACSWGVSAPGGMSAPGGCLLLGGVSALGGSAPGGCIPACTEADTPLWTESQTPVKTLPWPNFVAAGNDVCKHETQILYCYSLFCKQ